MSPQKVLQKSGYLKNLPYFCSVFNDNRMEWLKELLVEHSALQAVVVISLISTIGIGLGKIRFFGLLVDLAGGHDSGKEQGAGKGGNENGRQRFGKGFAFLQTLLIHGGSPP